MKTITPFLVAVVLLFNLTANAQTQTWSNDPAHSQLYFTVTHLGFNDISGTFDDTSVTATATKADFSDAQFELNAKTNSINTLVETRDNHLKSADFFDAEKYPTITFKSTGIKKVDDTNYKLTGELTMHGVTKSVSLDLVYNGQTTNPMNEKLTTAFMVTGSLKRSDFSVGDKFPEVIISDEVRIKFSGEFVQE